MPSAGPTVSSTPRLDPPVAVVARRPTVRFLLSHPAHAIALGFGSGLSPVAPGTVGTLWAWLAYVAAPPARRRVPVGRRDRRLGADRLVGLHRDGAPSRARRSGRHRLGRSRRLLARALARHAGRLLGPGRRLRAVPDLRRGQAGSGGLGRCALQGPTRPADRLAAGLRASCSTTWSLRCARCWSSRCGGPGERLRIRGRRRWPTHCSRAARCWRPPSRAPAG